MKEISEIAGKQEEICLLIKAWGFNTDPSDPPKIYPDLYKPSQKAALCILVIPSKLPEDIFAINRQFLLEYELARMLGCKINVATMANINRSMKTTVEATAIAIHSTEEAIISHYNAFSEPRNYEFAPIDLVQKRKELRFSSEQALIQEIERFKPRAKLGTSSKPDSKSLLYFFASRPSTSSHSTDGDAEKEESFQLK